MSSNSRYYQTTMQLMDPTVRGASKSGNVAWRSTLRDSGLDYANLHLGVVVQSHAGAYDAQVRIGRHNPIPCIQSAELNAYTSGFGMTTSRLLQEGTVVLVYKPQSFGALGIILATVPVMYGGKASEEKAAAFMTDPEPSAAAFTETSYRDPLEDTKYPAIANANAGRALDMFPGDWGQFNELGVGLGLLHLAVQLRASARSKVECYCLDDLVRVISGQYQHFSGMGEEHIYNDFGYVTHEWLGSMHQCEVLGMPKYDEAPVQAGSADTDKAKECEWKAKKDGMVPHRRFHGFMGHLGGLFQWFGISPSDDSPSTYGAADDKGLAHVAVDDCGRITVRSVSDIRLERCDVISVPRKNKEPWDPAGEKIEDGYTPEKKKPFGWKKEDHPAKHVLQERDYFAWARKMTYLRFWELSDLNGKKDWILKEEADAPKPRNKYDVIIENEEDYEEWEDRTSSVTLRKDGGITLRNSFGAEISLCGEDVIITCPGDIQLRPGRQLVTLAKDDIVLKAQHSVDITATSKDVRIKAEKKLLQYAGETALIEAGAVDADAEAGPGEAGNLPKGIMLRAKENIVLWADVMQLSFKAKLVLEGVLTGVSKIYAAVHDFFLASDKFLLTAKTGGEPAGVMAQGGTAVLYGGGAHIIAKDSANIIRGGKAGIFIDWADVTGDPYAPISQQANALHSQTMQDDDWLGAFSDERRKKIGFAYRTEDEYSGSDMPRMAGAPESRMFCESFWTYLQRKSGATIGEWGGDVELRKSLPWPGKRHYDSPGLLHELSEETNIGSDGKLKTFEERKPTGGELTPATFRKYKG